MKKTPMNYEEELARHKQMQADEIKKEKLKRDSGKN